MEARGEFRGRTALVTGGARGIGRECCELLANEGAQVAINYRSSEQAAEQTAKICRELGTTAEVYRADVSDQHQVQALIEQVESELGGVDLLINNAGIFELRPHDEMSFAHWQETVNCNLNSAYLVTWAVKQRMIEQKYGRIVNVSSIAGLRARPTAIAYSVSKAGMIALTRSLGEALAETGVRVNAVAPGLIDTPILKGVDTDVIDGLIDATPMKRLGEPAEIAAVVRFLLSDESSFMTGQTLVASGGRVHLP